MADAPLRVLTRTLPAPPVGDIVRLVSELVRIPTQGGLDPLDPVVDHLDRWLALRGIEALRLAGPAGPVGLYVKFRGREPGPTWILDAPLDTAVVGAPSSWQRDPFSGEVTDGWLYGRGSADCKAAISIFSHLAVALATHPPRHGSVGILFDGDEHTGGFGGVRAFLEVEEPSSIGGLMLGYPGADKIVVGGRGILRLSLGFRGPGGHSGSRSPHLNPAVKAAALVTALDRASLPPDPDFPVGPKLTVTAIVGGAGYSTVPDLVTVNVDVRLTPTFDEHAARAHVLGVVAATDDRFADHPATEVAEEPSWPAYRTPLDSPIVEALQAAVTARLGAPVPTVVAGPANIGNLLALHSIPATAGFGVTCRGLHAPDEQIEVASLLPTYDVYAAAITSLTAPGPDHR